MTTAREVTRSAKMCTARVAAGTMTDRPVAAAHAMSACRSVSAATAAGMALGQCRPSACQDQSQRANRQKNALALDAHLPLLPRRT